MLVTSADDSHVASHHPSALGPTLPGNTHTHRLLANPRRLMLSSVLIAAV